MRVLAAPDSYKGCLRALTVAEAMREGVFRACPNAHVELLPAADGGEGTVEALVRACGGRRITRRVTGPLGAPVDAQYGLLKDGCAVIEMAAAVGLPLVAHGARDPLAATTYGVGELILDAVGRGARRVVIGLGGSATNDGGAGMLQALGARLDDAHGAPIPRGGGGLARLRSTQLDGLSALRGVDIIAACDVRNPLLGPEGATRVFGPQKGVTEDTAPLLEEGLELFASALYDATGLDTRALPGAGAAGGMGAALLGALGARFVPGIELFIEMSDFKRRAREADIILTGEGHTDAQTAYGKAPAGIAAAAQGRPVVVLSGGVTGDMDALHKLGVTAVFPVCPRPMPLRDALEGAYRHIAYTAEHVCRLFLAAPQQYGDIM